MSWQKFLSSTVYSLRCAVFDSIGVHRSYNRREARFKTIPEIHLNCTEYARIMRFRLPMLTARELQVAWCIRRGYSNEEIASALQISLATVKTHVHNILLKTNLHSRWRLREILVEMEDGILPK